MRYTRLRRQIESGTLIGTHGTPFSGSADKIYEASTKRKRPNSSVKKSDDETEDEEPQPPNRKAKKSGNYEKGKRKRGGVEAGGENTEKGKGGEVKVKEEGESEFESDDSSFEDAEDEMPLAKLRKARLGPFQSSSSVKPYISPYPSRMMSPSEVPRSMAGFQRGMGGTMGEGAGLGSRVQSPVGHNTGFGNGGGNGGAGGWGEVDWARWQSRFAGGEGMKDSL
jgi:hypothetical protein